MIFPFPDDTKKRLRKRLLSKSNSNQFYLSTIAWGVVAQSPEPGAHLLNARAFRIELEFRNVGFCREGKTGVPGEKPLGAEKRTNSKLNPHMTSSPRIEPGPHWWKASALTTASSLRHPSSRLETLCPKRGKNPATEECKNSPSGYMSSVISLCLRSRDPSF